MLDPDADNPEFIEFHIKDYKTKASKTWTAGALVAVAPASGVVGSNWISHWLEVRTSLGIDPGVHPVMPAPDCDGAASVRSLTTTEATRWLNMVMDRAELLRVDRRLSSHSGKATLLSYMARWGASLNTREMLVGHTSHVQSVLCYSRDSLSGPLRELGDMLAAVRGGNFFSRPLQVGTLR